MLELKYWIIVAIQSREAMKVCFKCKQCQISIKFACSKKLSHDWGGPSHGGCDCGQFMNEPPTSEQQLSCPSEVEHWY